MAPISEADAYQSVSDTVSRVAMMFYRRLHGRYYLDELLSDAQLYALEAIRRFDGRGNLEGWVAWLVSQRLSRLTSSRKWRRHSSKGIRIMDITQIPNRERFDLPILLSQLSKDAGQIIEICLDGRIFITPSSVYSLLRDLGWKPRRIILAFEEIREAL